VLSTLFKARIVLPSNLLVRSISSGSTCGFPPRLATASLASAIRTSTSIPSSAAATSFIICRFSTVFAWCRPGVSISTTCPSCRVTIPWMRLRVVWGFEVTIAIFCPTSRFTSVDFPAFGRPTMATNPARYPRFSFLSFTLCSLTLSSTRAHCGAGKLLHLHAQHLPLVGFQHLKPVSLKVKLVARRRHLSAYVAQQAGNRRHGFIGGFSEVHSQHLLNVLDAGASAHHHRTGSVAPPLPLVVRCFLAPF